MSLKKKQPNLSKNFTIQNFYILVFDLIYIFKINLSEI